MDKETIEELIELMDKAQLTALRVDDGTIKVELERTPSSSSAALPLMTERAVQLLSSNGAHGIDLSTEGGEDTSTVFVRSPMVGTFYVAPSPDEAPFVNVGQDIQAGQTLAIVEAMKMMNEIVAESSGTILEVLAANATQVEYDQPLFRIGPQ